MTKTTFLYDFVDRFYHLFIRILSLSSICFLMVYLFAGVLLGFTPLLMLMIGTTFVVLAFVYVSSVLYAKNPVLAHVILALFPAFIGCIVGVVLNSLSVILGCFVISALISILIADLWVCAAILITAFGVIAVQILWLSSWIQQFFSESVLQQAITVAIIGLVIVIFTILVSMIASFIEQFSMSNKENQQRLQLKDDEQRTMTLQLNERIKYQNHLFAVLEELEVKLIPLSKGVFVLPLIGYFDAQRMLNLDKHVLSEARAVDAQVILFDVSELQMFEKHSIDALRLSIDALHLLGIDVGLIGMHPKLARLFADNNVTRRTLKSFVQLQDALDLFIKV